jgi:hypothetical protein
MPHPRAVESRDRDANKKLEARLLAEKAAVDARWKDEHKERQVKEQRTKEKDDKDQERTRKEAEKRELLEKEQKELEHYGKNRKQVAATTKVTRATVMANALAHIKPQKKKETVETIHDIPLIPNMNRENAEILARGGEVVDASGIDGALVALKLTETPAEAGDLHPEKRVKALHKAYEERRMVELKVEFPGLKLSQLKEKIFKEWQKAPENPLRNK